MQQVLFQIPFLGYPLFGFGAMLLLSFVVVVGWGKWRTPKVGLSWERFQDMAMLLLATGIAGARIVYMIQYHEQFPDQSLPGLFVAFFSIWDGGIVFYGSIFGGFLGYLMYRQRVIKKFGINGWQLADAVAPLLAIGMAIGRIGCYLNGCCWGQVACEQCQPMPLPPELGQFPLLSAHAKRQVTWPPDETARLPQIHGLQTTTGFSIPPKNDSLAGDLRTVVRAVEPGSAAERAGLQPGDRVIELNGSPNAMVLEISGSESVLSEATKIIQSTGLVARGVERSGVKQAIIVESNSREELDTVLDKLTPLKTQLEILGHDRVYELARNAPLSIKSLDLVVERNGERIPISFIPRTRTFFPTQIYETISMVLITILLLTFQPFRRHDGQVMVLLMVVYAIHRFLNEAIRIEPTYRFGLTLSQWISIGIFLAAILLELYLRWCQPKLPPGAIPLGYGAKPAPDTAKS